MHYRQNATIAFLVMIRAAHALRSSFCPSCRTTFVNKQRNYSRKSSMTMMPEGPEVRALVDSLKAGFTRPIRDFTIVSGRYTKTEPTGYQQFKQLLARGEERLTITEWGCKGKFIYIRLMNQQQLIDCNTDPEDLPPDLVSIWITLGMSGRLINEASYQQNPSNMRWYITVGSENIDNHVDTTKIYYRDTRNFGTVKFCFNTAELIEKLNSLGHDIFTVTFYKFYDVYNETNGATNICKFLMNQSKIAGVGNYLLAEGLYKANIDPFCILRDLNEKQVEELHGALQSLAWQSYNAQRPGTDDRTSFSLQCYGREKTPSGEAVIREPNGPHNRTIWYTEKQLQMPRREKGNDQTHSYNDKNNDDDDDDDDEIIERTELARTDLLSGLTDESWKAKLDDAIQAPSFAKVASFIKSELDKKVTIYPPSCKAIFHAFNVLPFDKVKVVIIGQDPYHSPGLAYGLSFSVQTGIKPPPSLENIFNEIVNDPDIETMQRLPSHGNLDAWVSQGVLLLNSVLTVRRGMANSHAKQGWEDFTDAVIDALAKERKDGLVFLLWGNPAAKKAANIDTSIHSVIKTSHPSPLGATKTKSPFTGSRCFSRCNAELIKLGKSPIDWAI